MLEDSLKTISRSTVLRDTIPTEKNLSQKIKKYNY